MTTSHEPPNGETPVLHEPCRHPVVECLKALKYGRNVRDQKKLDELVKSLEDPAPLSRPTYPDTKDSAINLLRYSAGFGAGVLAVVLAAMICAGTFRRKAECRIQHGAMFQNNSDREVLINHTNKNGRAWIILEQVGPVLPPASKER